MTQYILKHPGVYKLVKKYGFSSMEMIKAECQLKIKAKKGS